MSWKAYEVIFRLCSPMHIGLSKVGNLQQTRPYVVGRVFWGALAMRLTRERYSPATDSAHYKKVGGKIHSTMAFTYFYPALSTCHGYQVVWPWDKSNTFTYRFIRSYMSAALSYPMQSAAEGKLHEMEFLSPCTLDTGEQVFMLGYVFIKDDCTLDWEAVLDKLQFGGERGYGWGDVRKKNSSLHVYPSLFDGSLEVVLDGEKPVVSIRRSNPLLAHCLAKDQKGVIQVEGTVEPLVGREWDSTKDKYHYAGQHIAFNNICFAPGSIVTQDSRFTIGDYGIWYPFETSAS